MPPTFEPQQRELAQQRVEYDKELGEVSEAAQKAAPRAKREGGLGGLRQPVGGAPEQAGCDNYRVDMTASRFGDCVCGFPKSAHSADATVRGADNMPLSTYDKPTDLRNKPRVAGGRAARLAQQRAHVNEKLAADFFACDEYRVDMTAARFGDCKCGKVCPARRAHLPRTPCKHAHTLCVLVA